MMTTKKLLFGLGAAAGMLGAVVALRRRPDRSASAVRSGAATAAITGASSGIGAAFARKLAGLGHDLVLIARREDRLAALAAELEGAHGVRAEILAADLVQEADVERVAARLAAVPNLELLVNNAGVSGEGRFCEAAIGPELDMIRLHVLASVRLAHAVLPRMVERGRGGVINVASLMGFMALPGNVQYCATKGYLITFTKSLALELAGTGVRVQALCPSLTHTEFHDDLRRFDKTKMPAILWMPADAVAEASLRGLARGQTICIPGFGNRLLVMLGSSPLATPAIRLFLR